MAPGKEPLVNHTYACLVARRGKKSLDEYYGPRPQENDRDHDD